MHKTKHNSKQQQTPAYDSDTGSEDESTETSVDVGYVDPTLYAESTSVERKINKTLLKSPFFASKVGGKPSWLNYFSVPLASETSEITNNNNSAPSVRMQCANCQAQMKFLLQIYAPISDNDKLFKQLENVDDVFHRVLYIFLCTNQACSPVRSRAIKVYRSQLKHKNEFFSANAPPADVADDEKDQQNADKHLLEFYRNLYEKNLMGQCEVCGLGCTKKCAKCKFTSYCCQSHQVFDWSKNNHKEVCEGYLHWSTVENDTDELLKLFIEKENAPGSATDQGLNEHVFPELEILIEPEVIETPSPVNKKSQKAAFDEEKLAADLESNCALDQDLDNVKETECDRDFEKFTKRTKDEPTQIVRYDRGGEPLWVTRAEKLKKDSSVPKCVHCGSKRVFEFQVNPQLLNYLGLDETNQLNSIDWAGLYVYTCSKSCKTANRQLVEEFIYKQDFA